MQGTLVTGQGVGAEFVRATEDTLAAAVGFKPYPGTVNLEGVEAAEELPLRSIDDDLGDPHCEGVHLRPCSVGGIRSAIIRPLVPNYPDPTQKVELLAPVRLRDVFGFDEGATVPLAPHDDPWSPTGPRASPAAINAFDVVVFDLDGTLVDLTIDWGTVHDEIETQFGSYLEKPVTEHDRNELFEMATANGIYDDLVGLIEVHERRGAAEATALAGVHELDTLDVPIGICTANAASAAERALERFGVREAVDVIVARETIRPGKPDPGPLVTCLERLDAPPGNALFVGDQRVDAETAARATTSFLHIEQLWPTD